MRVGGWLFFNRITGHVVKGASAEVQANPGTRQQFGAVGRIRTAFKDNFTRSFDVKFPWLAFAAIGRRAGDFHASSNIAAYPAFVLAKNELVIRLGAAPCRVEHPEDISVFFAGSVHLDEALAAIDGKHLTGEIFTVGNP